jgi:hypothetical protein
MPVDKRVWFIMRRSGFPSAWLKTRGRRISYHASLEQASPMSATG